MRTIGRAAQVRRAWRDAVSDLPAAEIWWKHCALAWPSTALPVAPYGAASTPLQRTGSGGDGSPASRPPDGEDSSGSGSSSGGQQTKTSWESFQAKQQQGHQGQQEHEPAAAAASSPAGVGGGSGGRFLSDPKRLYRGMTLAMRAGLDVVLPWPTTMVRKNAFLKPLHVYT